jgi:hypothetical protein
VRRYSSADKPEPVEEKDLDVPTYWVRPTQVLSAEAGAHRFIWDLHYPPPEGGRRSYPIAAIYKDTPSHPLGPVVLPGQYTVVLKVAGKSYTQPMTVKMDPRVKTPAEGLAQQFTLAMQSYEGMREIHQVVEQMQKLRGQLKERQASAGQGPLADALGALDGKIAALSGRPMRGRRGRGMMGETTSLMRVQGELSALLGILEGADATPTTQVVAACERAKEALGKELTKWHDITSKEVKALNEQLLKVNLQPLSY